MSLNYAFDSSGFTRVGLLQMSVEYANVLRVIYMDINHNESWLNALPFAESYTYSQVNYIVNAYVNLQLDEELVNTYNLKPYNAGTPDDVLLIRLEIISSQNKDLVKKVLDRLYYNTIQSRGIASTKYLDPLGYKNNEAYSNNTPSNSQSWLDKVNPFSSDDTQGLVANVKDLLEGTILLAIIGGGLYVGYQLYQGTK